IDAGFMHVEPDGVELIASGLSQAVAGGVAGVSLVRQPQGSLGNDPTITRAFGQSQNVVVRICLGHHLGRLTFVIGPSDQNVRVGLDLKQRHSQVSNLLNLSAAHCRRTAAAASNKQVAAKTEFRRANAKPYIPKRVSSAADLKSFPASLQRLPRSPLKA